VTKEESLESALLRQFEWQSAQRSRKVLSWIAEFKHRLPGTPNTSGYVGQGVVRGGVAHRLPGRHQLFMQTMRLPTRRRAFNSS
jgi:hypothetical protein